MSVPWPCAFHPCHHDGKTHASQALSKHRILQPVSYNSSTNPKHSDRQSGNDTKIRMSKQPQTHQHKGLLHQ